MFVLADQLSLRNRQRSILPNLQSLKTRPYRRTDRAQSLHDVIYIGLSSAQLQFPISKILD